MGKEFRIKARSRSSRSWSGPEDPFLAKSRVQIWSWLLRSMYTESWPHKKMERFKDDARDLKAKATWFKFWDRTLGLSRPRLRMAGAMRSTCRGRLEMSGDWTSVELNWWEWQTWLCLGVLGRLKDCQAIKLSFFEMECDVAMLGIARILFWEYT